MKKNFLKWPISVISGILVIVFYCIFTFISLALFPPPYSPLDNWLSDLGNSTYSPNGAIFYNIGCILTGSALFPFYIGLYKWYTEKIWHKILVTLTQIVGVASGFALIMIGIFSEDFPQPHIFWSEVFFELNLLVLILAGISLLFHPDFIKIIAIYGFVVAVINLTFIFLVETPLLEWFTVFTALGYAGLIIYNMYLKMIP
ncbi:MAG: DUF998 domain-containing protein [Promethearchaeota archaeon]|nr:MAG: DUF998 domain-containing protein [Candidatus Lokiarchaeota archaeon]